MEIPGGGIGERRFDRPRFPTVMQAAIPLLFKFDASGRVLRDDCRDERTGDGADGRDSEPAGAPRRVSDWTFGRQRLGRRVVGMALRRERRRR